MYAVVLAGGGGTRLWPLSRAARPKPFLPLLGDATLLQQTVARLSPLIAPGDVYVVTDARYVAICREQLPDVPASNVIGEPIGRNTAAAVALAAVAIERPGDAVMAVLPADHRIADEAGFRAALAAAVTQAASGDLVTLGIEPTGPETGYGYVLAAGAAESARVAAAAGVTGPAGAAGAAGVGGRAVLRVERFVEKPTAERAAELLAGGHAYWNAGIFVWRRDAVLAGLDRHAAHISGPIRDAIASASDLGPVYAALSPTSIDYALMEPVSLEGRVAVVPVDLGWSDLGSWSALLEALGGGSSDAGVAARVQPPAETIDVGSADVLVHADGGRMVVTIGLRDVIVVDTPDVLLVCAADAAQDVKKVVDRLTAEGRRERL